MDHQEKTRPGLSEFTQGRVHGAPDAGRMVQRQNRHRSRLASSLRGAERVLEQILQLCPGADLFTLMESLPKDQRGFIMDKPVQTLLHPESAVQPEKLPQLLSVNAACHRANGCHWLRHRDFEQLRFCERRHHGAGSTPCLLLPFSDPVCLGYAASLSGQSRRSQPACQLDRAYSPSLHPPMGCAHFKRRGFLHCQFQVYWQTNSQGLSARLHGGLSPGQHRFVPAMQVEGRILSDRLADGPLQEHRSYHGCLPGYAG